MTISMDAAAELYRQAMRDGVRRFSLLYLAQSGLLVLAGFLSIISPVFSDEAVVGAIGWLLIASGVLQAIGLIPARQTPYVWLQLISAVLALLIGFLILRNPGQSLMTFGVLLVVFFMIEGVSKVVWALTIRPIIGWLWVLLSGVLGVVLSIILIINLETAAPWLIAIFVGLQLIAIGAAIGYLAWSIRQIGNRSNPIG
ncbi:HdeD family acid-resistance protein [Pelagibacterium sp.]|uniref:HdeD family acid-resistance protein n=1 Tax=Pelagibacterium sp. TaxID=1967288 RepID=UPI003A91E414